MKPNRTAGIMVAAVLFLGLFGSLDIRDVSAADPQELVNLFNSMQNKNPGINLKFWVEGVDASAKTAKVGQRVVFCFQADKDCYVHLINIGTSGETVLLFPNEFDKESKVIKDKVYKIPPEGVDYAFEVGGPAGVERIKVLACLDPITAESTRAALTQAGVPFAQLGGVHTKDIFAKVAKVDPAKWGAADYSFDVVTTGDSGAKPKKEEAGAKTEASGPAEDAEALYRMAMNYLEGKGGYPKDVKKAAEMLVDAAERGHAGAKKILSEMDLE